MRIWSLLAVLSITTLFGAPHLAPGLSNVPLSFEPGLQHSEFIAHLDGLGVRVTPTGASFGVRRMGLAGARARAAAQPEELLAGYTNYLLDPDPRKWRTHVPNYRRVRYHDIYPGIDVVYYGNPRELEFDFIVAPGADPHRIRLALSGTDLRVRLPRAYQDDHSIEVRAVRHGASVTFELGAYDRTQPLVIDPVLSFATVFGSGGFDEGRAIAVDSAGATYVAGDAFDGNFPVVNGKSGSGSFVAKVNPAGDALVFSTYLTIPQGSGGNFAIDSSGSAYFVSAVYPGNPGLVAVGPPPLGNCASPGPPQVYVAKLAPGGDSIVYSGCLGGSSYQFPSAMAVDGAGNAYVAGMTSSADFPVVNPLPSIAPPTNQGPPKAFVLKLGSGGALLYSTFFGGRNGDGIQPIAADSAGNIYLSGHTNSPDFPLKNPLQSAPSSGSSAFLAKINVAGADLVYSTYFGGSNSDNVSAIATDSKGNVYVAGSTSSGDFPTTPNALQSKYDGTFAYKSTDGGANWSRGDTGLPGSVNVLRIDLRNPSNLYAVSSGRVYKSTDSGATWQATKLTPVISLWLNPADSTLYGITPNSGPGRTTTSILRSRDGGATFSTLDTGLGATLNQMAFDPENSAVIYARFGGSGAGDGIYKSTDGGDTWKPTGLTGAATGQGGLAVDPANPSTLYAATRQRGLQRSEDGGGTWTMIGGQVDEVLVDSSSILYSVSGNTVLVLPPGGVTVVKTAPASISILVIDPADSSTWYAVTFSSPGPGNSIYKSTDGGDTWQRVGAGLPNSPAVGSLALDPSAPGTLYLGAFAQPDGFFAKLNADGTSLLYSTYLGGSGSDSLTAIAIDVAGNTYLAGTTDSADFPMQAPFRSSATQGADGIVAKFDQANTLAWSSLLGGGTPRAIAPGPAGEVYLTGSTSSAAFPTANSIQGFISSDFFRTADRGATWTPSTLPMSSPTQFGPFSTPAVAIDPKTLSRVYALADRLYVSNDRGQNWTPLGSPSGTPGGLLAPFAGPLLLLDPLTPTTMYAVAGCAPAPDGPPICGVSKSTDGGMTWTLQPINAPGPGPQPQPVFVSGLAIHPKTPSILYASAFNAGLFKSTDSGKTWTATFPLMNAVALALDPLNPAIVYTSIGSAAGLIFKSTDAGANWATINNGLPSGWLARVLVADASVAGRVYAGGSLPYTGLYRSDNGGGSWIKIGSGLPDGSTNALVLDPGAPSTVYVASSAGGLYRSTDAGVNFTLVPGLRIPLVNAIAIDPTSSSRIYTGTQFNVQDAFVMKISP